MSNRLEREFPEVAWRAVPPTGPRGLPPEAVRGYVARGRELRARAVRDGVRLGFGIIAWALFWRRRSPAPGSSPSDAALG